jgi:hypothetical protein
LLVLIVDVGSHSTKPRCVGLSQRMRESECSLANLVEFGGSVSVPKISVPGSPRPEASDASFISRVLSQTVSRVLAVLEAAIGDNNGSRSDITANSQRQFNPPACGANPLISCLGTWLEQLRFNSARSVSVCSILQSLIKERLHYQTRSSRFSDEVGGIHTQQN